jgi:hypothetical protein
MHLRARLDRSGELGEDLPIGRPVVENDDDRHRAGLVLLLSAVDIWCRNAQTVRDVIEKSGGELRKMQRNCFGKYSTPLQKNR